MQATSIREANGSETALPSFGKHLLCAEDGLFPEEFNSWEGDVVQAELGRAETVGLVPQPGAHEPGLARHHL
jgi:type III restriction enzyme